jgi:hypothetical protein
MSGEHSHCPDLRMRYYLVFTRYMGYMCSSPRLCFEVDQEPKLLLRGINKSASASNTRDLTHAVNLFFDIIVSANVNNLHNEYQYIFW